MARKEINYGASRDRRINLAVRNYENVRPRFHRAPNHQNPADPRSPRRARLQDDATGSTVSCKLLDADGNEVGDAFNVQLFETADAAFPTLASGKDIPVFLDVNGTWYACFVMIPYTTCE